MSPRSRDSSTHANLKSTWVDLNIGLGDPEFFLAAETRQLMQILNQRGQI